MTKKSLTYFSSAPSGHMRTGHKVRNNLPHTLLTASVFLNTPAHSTQKFLAGHSARPSTVSMKRWYCPLSLKCWKPLQNTVQWAGTIRQALWALRRDWRSGTKPHEADRAVTGRAKRRDRKAESQMEWVRQMNACKAQAEEIVKAELIYDWARKSG